MSAMAPLVVGWALISGMDWRLVTLLALAILQPWLVIALVGVLVLVEARRVRRQGSGCSEEAQVLLGVAGELRAGLGVRSAMAAAGQRSSRLDFHPVRRLVASGAPLDRISEAVTEAMPVHGSLASAALRVADRTGGRVAEVFDSAAALALEEDELRQERRAATAQARTSAVVVVGIPVLVVIYRILSGSLSRSLSANPLSALLTVAGITLLALGVAVMLVLIKRASP
ncbi:MAG: type II secretion system F family protein [bacterium]|nr:type II secretion system F family protein [bacterium]